MKKEGSRFLITIPMHRRDIPKGTLRGIIEDAGLTVEEFNQLVRGRRV